MTRWSRTNRDEVVHDLLNNKCLREPHPLFQFLQQVFPCPLSYETLQNEENEDHRRVKELVYDLFTKPTAKTMINALLDDSTTTKQVYTFVRDVLDAYMRKHFQLSPNTAQAKVVSAFDTSFMQDVSVVKRVIESKTDPTVRFNVFIAIYKIRDAPSRLAGRIFEQVILIQPKGHVDDALAKMADSYGVMYCFAPAGQLTCKPLEYAHQTLFSMESKKADVLRVGNYRFVGEFLSGMFPAQNQ